MNHSKKCEMILKYAFSWITHFSIQIGQVITSWGFELQLCYLKKVLQNFEETEPKNEIFSHLMSDLVAQV